MGLVVGSRGRALRSASRCCSPAPWSTSRTPPSRQDHLPGLLPALTADLALVLGVALIVSGVVKWWRQRRGTPIQPSTPAVSYADPRNEERLRHSDETVHREAHEMVNGATYCPSCGNASQHEDRFCRSCGAPTAPRPVPPSSLVAQAGAAQRSETETLLARERDSADPAVKPPRPGRSRPRPSTGRNRDLRRHA